jgi:hypothetical protein
MKKQWTVLLLRPDFVASEFGHDTYCTHVEAKTPSEALRISQEEACITDELDVAQDRDSYYCLFCVEGHVHDYTDGSGGVVDP